MSSERHTNAGLHCKQCGEHTLHIHAEGDPADTLTCSVCRATKQQVSAAG
jgi:hypothetical protein